MPSALASAAPSRAETRWWVKNESADVVGFLRVLVGGARAPEHHPVGRQALANFEGWRRHPRPALHAGQRAGATGVDNQQSERRRRPAHQRLQLLERKRRSAGVERPRVAVAGIEHEQDGRSARGADAVVHPDQRAAHVLGAAALDQHDVLGQEIAQLGEHVAEALGVVEGVAQRRLVGLAGVFPDQHRIADDLRRRCPRREQHREHHGRHRPHQRPFERVRVSTWHPCGTASAPVAASPLRSGSIGSGDTQNRP